MNSPDYTDQCVVITGAGSGIGRASALRFAELGAAVVVNDIDAERARQTAASIRAAGGIATEHAGNITDPQQVDTLVNTACQHYGGVQVMFNNAGGALPVPLLDSDPASFQEVMALNFNAAYYGTLAALKIMLPQGGGCILSTSSGAGLRAVPGLAIYGSAKAAVQNLMRSVAVEYGRQGIRANAICPGAMDTEGLRGWLDTLPGGVQAYNEEQPMGRLGRPEEIANAAVYLASDQASYINGAVIPVDGATHAMLASPRR